MIPGIVAGQGILAAGGGGGTPGAWDLASAAMDAGVFNLTNTDATLDNDAGQGGSIRNTTAKNDANWRYVEIVVNDYGNLPTLGMFVGLSVEGSTMQTSWHNGLNQNATWTPDGTRNTDGQSDAETTGFADVAFGGSQVPGDVLAMRFKAGVGAQCRMTTVANGISPWQDFPPFTPSGAFVFACIGFGNFGNIGDNQMLTILTTGATQIGVGEVGDIPWDD